MARPPGVAGSRSIAGLACALALALPAPAAALPPAEEAELLARAARDLAEKGDFKRAADAYERAFELAPDRKYVWNAGRLRELSGELARAHGL
jgi:tetratricopeptide (TPR) repeat protein